MNDEIRDVEVVHPQTEAMPLIMQGNGGLITDEAIKRAELQIEGIKKIKALSIRVTNEDDWVIFEGKPTTQNSGNMKIAQLWGVSFLSPKIEETRRNDEKGEYIEFTISGYGEWNKRQIHDIGTFSTRDPLLGKVKGEYRPLCDVDLQDVKKAALSNWQSRILRKVLGLSFNLDDLKNAGLDVAKIKGTKFASGGQGGGIISEAQAKRMFAIAHTANVSEAECLVILKKYGYEHSKDVKREHYEKICSEIEAKGKEPNY